MISGQWYTASNIDTQHATVIISQWHKANNWTFDNMFGNVTRKIEKLRDTEGYATQELTFTFSTSYSGSSDLTHYATVHLEFKPTATTVIDTVKSNTLPERQNLNRSRKYRRIESDTE